MRFINHARGIWVSGALVLVPLIVIASACGEQSSSARPPTQSATAGRPQGDPIPAQLQGDWVLSAAAADAYAGGTCPKPLAIATCMFKLTFTATTFQVTSNVAGYSGGHGEAVVYGAEIDFFNGTACGLQLPDGVGRYTWTETGGLLRFTLIRDPCQATRSSFLADRSFSRSS